MPPSSHTETIFCINSVKPISYHPSGNLLILTPALHRKIISCGVRPNQLCEIVSILGIKPRPSFADSAISALLRSRETH